MPSEDNQVEEIDLYAVIELLWSKLYIILGTSLIFVAVSAAVLFISRENGESKRDHYLTSTVTYAPNDANLKKFNLKIRGKQVVPIDEDGTDWLKSVANAVDIGLLRDTFEWTINSGSPISDWLSTNLKESLSDEQQFHEFYKRLDIKLDDQEIEEDKIIASLETRASFEIRRPKLVLTFISDTPISGTEISQHIIKSAQEKAFERLKVEFVNNIYSLLDDEDAGIFAKAEQLYLGRIAERINKQRNEAFNREGIEKLYVEKVLGTKISETTRYQHNFYVKDEKNKLDEEILTLIEQMRLLREKHTKLILSRERDTTFLPDITSEKLMNNFPSFTESVTVIDWYNKKSFVKTLSTAAFFGFIFGVILVLIMDGLKKRRSFKSLIA